MRSLIRFAAVIISMSVFCGTGFAITPAEIFSKAGQNGTLNSPVIKDMVKVITFNSFNNKSYEYEAEFGKEYLAGYTGQLITSEYNGRPSTGWKQGASSLNPTYQII